MATTWTFKRMPPSRDSPEFRRHIMGWFDEVRFTLASVCIILRQCIMLGEQVQVEVSRYFSLHVPDGYRALHSGMVWYGGHAAGDRLCSYSLGGRTPTWWGVVMLTMMILREASVSCTCATMAQGGTWWEDPCTRWAFRA